MQVKSICSVQPLVNMWTAVWRKPEEIIQFTEAEYHQLYSKTQLTGHEVYQQSFRTRQPKSLAEKTEALPNIYCSLGRLLAKQKQAKILLTKTRHESIGIGKLQFIIKHCAETQQRTALEKTIRVQNREKTVPDMELDEGPQQVTCYSGKTSKLENSCMAATPIKQNCTSWRW